MERRLQGADWKRGDGGMLSGNARYPGRFLGWWLGELRGCLTAALSGALFGTGERLEIALGTDEARISLARDGTRRELGSFDIRPGSGKPPDRAMRRLLRKQVARAAGVTLRLPAAQVLRPSVELPAAAAENLREVLAFEMDRFTPFASGEVLFDFRVSGSDDELQRLNVDLLVARKPDIDRAMTLAAAIGVSPDCIAGPAEASPGFNLLPQDRRRRPGRLLPRLTGLMAVVTLVLAGTAFGLSLDRKQKTLALLEGRIAELRAATGETGRLEEKVDRLATLSGYLAAKKQTRPLMVDILDELTRRLPDQHYLINYSYRDGTVQLAGYSDDPSAMLRLLEESPLFSQVRFAAPVTMDPQIGKERFNLAAAVSHEGAGQ